MGCSAGDHETVPCPPVTPIAQPVGDEPAPIRSTIAAVTDRESAARLCFMRMGGHLASREERAKAKNVMGLSTVLVTESSTAALRFHFAELPEWVVEERGDACENGLPTATCHFGWFPSSSRSSAVSWANLRECSAAFTAHALPDHESVALGAGCTAAAWRWPAEGERDLPCALRNPATIARGGSFAIACKAVAPAVHPQRQERDLAAYRCVLPESALGTFDLRGR